jgi:hypothetical protein
MTLLTKWPRIDQGGIEAMDSWCREMEKPTLVVVDTLQMIRPAIGSKNMYEADVAALRGLQQLAGRWTGLSIVANHHDRKMGADDVFDTVAGTRGLTGTADTIAILTRQSGAVTLHVDGRDVEKAEHAIQFSKETCRWTLLGAAAEVHRSAERARVIAALSETGTAMTVAELIEAAELRNRNAADVLLSKMARAGELKRVRTGVYGLPDDAGKDGTDRKMMGACH